MKTINVTFTDKEHGALEAHKKQLKLNWHDYILACTGYAKAVSFKPREGEFVLEMGDKEEKA